MPLAAGTTVERDLAGGQSHSFKLAMSPGDFAAIILEQRGIDVVIQVVRPDGTVIADFDAESRTYATEFAGVVADASVTYTLRIKARYSKAVAGQYAIRVSEIRPATDAERSAFEMHTLGTAAGKLDEAGKAT